MTRLFVSFLGPSTLLRAGFSLILVSCSLFQPTATPAPPADNADLFDTPWEDRSPFKAGLVPSEQSVLNELPGASVYHLEFNIAEDLYHVTGSEEVRYTNTERSLGRGAVPPLPKHPRRRDDCFKCKSG
jgi:hypothetical protein